MKQNPKLFNNSMIVISVLIVAICAIVFASLRSGGGSVLKAKGTYAASCVCENPISGATQTKTCSGTTCPCDSGWMVYVDNCSTSCPSGTYTTKASCQSATNGYYSCTETSGCWKRGALHCYAGYSNSGGTCKKDPTKTKTKTKTKTPTNKPTTTRAVTASGCSSGCCCSIPDSTILGYGTCNDATGKCFCASGTPIDMDGTCKPANPTTTKPVAGCSSGCCCSIPDSTVLGYGTCNDTTGKCFCASGIPIDMDGTCKIANATTTK